MKRKISGSTYSGVSALIFKLLRGKSSKIPI